MCSSFVGRPEASLRTIRRRRVSEPEIDGGSHHRPLRWAPDQFADELSPVEVTSAG